MFVIGVTRSARRIPAVSRFPRHGLFFSIDIVLVGVSPVEIDLFTFIRNGINRFFVAAQGKEIAFVVVMPEEIVRSVQWETRLLPQIPSWEVWLPMLVLEIGNSHSIFLIAIVVWLVIEALCIFSGAFVPWEWRRLHRLFYYFYQPDDTLLYKIRPNLRDFKAEPPVAGLYGTYSTDEFGFRNVGRNYAQARIFFVGDSMVWGAWVGTSDGVSGVVETELGEPVINLGVGSYEFDRYETIFRLYVAKYQPAVVALGVFANDLAAALPIHGEHPGAGLEYYRACGWDVYERFPTHKKTLTYYLVRQAGRLVGARSFGRDEYNLPVGDSRVTANGLTPFRYRGAAKDYLKDPSATRHVNNKANDIIEIAAKNKVKLAVFLFPSKESTYDKDYRTLFSDSADYVANEESGFEMLCKQFQAKGVVCTDLTAIFRERGEKEPLYFPLDPHWNVAGNRLAGTEVARVLRSLLPRRDNQ